MLIASVVSCTNSKQQTIKQQTAKQQATEVDTTYVMPSPAMDLKLYPKEDIVNVLGKVKKVFKLDGEPIKGDRKLTFTKINAGIKTEYNIIKSNNPDWFDYLTIVFSSDKPTAFDELQALADTLSIQYKNNSSFEWDDEREQWTDGKQYIHIQKPIRDEQSGDVYSVLSVMPKGIEK